MSLHIIGFNGLPIATAMGIRPPVVLDEEVNRVGVVPTTSSKLPDNWWPKDSVMDLLQSRLYTPCEGLGTFEEGTIVFYVDNAFITGTDDACVMLEIPAGLVWKDPFYVGAMQFSRARSIADDWALTLSKAVYTACTKEAYKLAYIEHCRIGFALAALG